MKTLGCAGPCAHACSEVWFCCVCRCVLQLTQQSAAGSAQADFGGLQRWLCGAGMRRGEGGEAVSTAPTELPDSLQLRQLACVGLRCTAFPAQSPAQCVSR